MYDFETVAPTSPIFNYCTIYQKIPFQFSLDILLNSSFDYHHLDPKLHYQFLAKDRSDPRLKLIKHFIHCCFIVPGAIFFAFNKSFEISILKGLIDFLTTMITKSKRILHKLYQDWINKLQLIIELTHDLADVFTKGWIYYVDFLGSLSIKNILPAMVLDLNYQELLVNNGSQASDLFYHFLVKNISSRQWEKKFYPEMITYCNQDTLAMVAILQKILVIKRQYNL